MPQSTARLMALRTRLRQLNSSRTLGDSADMLEITRIILTQIVDLERILRVRAACVAPRRASIGRTVIERELKKGLQIELMEVNQNT